MPNPETIDGFTFTTELAGGLAGRPRVVSAHGPLLNKRKKVERDNSVPPISFATAAGVPAGYDRGHVISLGLGGPDHSKNLVPMLSYFNRNVYKQMENLLQLEVQRGPVYLGVMIEYHAEPWWMPSRFTFHRHHGDPLTPEEPQSLGHRIEARRKHRMDDELYTYLKKNAVADSFMKDLDGKFGYAMFEIVDGIAGLGAINGRAPGKFNRRQRECVWGLNVFNNNDGEQEGWLVSDAKDDPHKNLNPVGCLEFPEVDHITPYSSGGTNSFWNAQLTSAYYNRSKSAHADEGGDQAPLRRQHERESKKRRFNPDS